MILVLGDQILSPCIHVTLCDNNIISIGMVLKLWDSVHVCYFRREYAAVIGRKVYICGPGRGGDHIILGYGAIYLPKSITNVLWI